MKALTKFLFDMRYYKRANFQDCYYCICLDYSIHINPSKIEYLYLNYIDITITIGIELEPCTKEECEAAFNKVVQNLKEKI